MQIRFVVGVALLLSVLAACDQSLALGAEPNRLQAMVARQDLCDKVSYAKADGSVSQLERALILSDAKACLSHEEYLQFKQSLDRIAPSKKPAAKYVVKTKRKSPAKNPASLASQKRPVPQKTQDGLVIPAGAILPDRMAQPAFLR